MRICAVILNYFGAEDTIACALQLHRQKIGHIYIVDNSADKDQFEQLNAAFAPQKNITLLRPDNNLGFAAGVNHALRSINLSDFEAVLVMNNDTIITDGFVDALAKGSLAAGLQVAGPRIHHYPDTAKLWSRGSWYNAWFGLVTRRPLPLPGTIFYLTGCCLLIKKCVFEKIGLFDEKFFMYGEDVDFCVRAEQAGLKTGVIDSALLFHKTSASSLNNSLFYEQQVARAHLLLSRKIFKTRATRSLAALTKIPVLFMRALLRTLRFGNLNTVTGLLSALKHTDPCSTTGR